MKFQTIIIGGGLSGLVSGIMLAKSGHNVAVVSAGQSALHFSSGSFELLSRIGDKEVINPIRAIEELPASHPYKKVGAGKVKTMAKELKSILAEAGIAINGDEERNHYRITPLGMFKPAWLTFGDYATIKDPDKMPWRKVAIINLKGYLDFYPQFLTAGLEKKGVKCQLASFTLDELETLRKSTTEMRAANIARVITGKVIDEFARKIDSLSGDADAVLMPAVVGLFSSKPVDELRRKVRKPLYFISTMPTSVPGVRTQILLRNYFQHLGGTYLLGDKVSDGEFDGDILKNITTANLGDMNIEADNFILATGSFFSHGLVAAPDRIYEPVFGLDVEVTGNRADWFDKDIYKEQPYMKFGVVTDNRFNVRKNGKTIRNMYAAGSVLGGSNAMKDGAGAGISIVTSMYVVNEILKS